MKSNFNIPRNNFQCFIKQKQVSKIKKTPSNILTWQAQKFENFERHPWWSISIFIILIFFLTYSLLADNFLLSIIIIISGVIIYLFEKKDPETYHFTICKTGIIAHDHFYEFITIESFWIFYEPGPVGRKEISIKTTHRFLPYAYIPLGNKTNPNKIRKILKKYLPEEQHQESILDFLENII
jgi:hypothetical protein